jgi:hypothetical protein
MKRFVLLGIALAAAGCSGGPKIASVSGVVTLDGRPYPNAVVSFQPLGSKDAPNPGRGSAGVTDEKGQFTLRYDGVKNGAVVGKHRVRIFTRLGAEPGQDDGAPDPPPARKPNLVEPIPADWHEQSTREFEVPPRGTKEANFAIVTGRAGK